MNTRFASLVPVTLALAAALPATTQVLTPAEFAQRLAAPDAGHLAPLITRFRLRDDNTATPCANFDQPTVKSLWTAKPELLTAIEISSRSCLTKFLILFRRSQNNWTYSGTIALNQRYNQPTYDVLPLLPGPSPAIVIRGNVVDAGSGISQKNMQIFALLDHTLRLVFNQPESINLAVPFKPDCCPVEYVEKQSSTFQISPASSTPQIDETRRIQVNDNSLVQYRSYHWNVRLQSFISVAFAPTP